MSNVVFGYMTAPSLDVAKKISRRLVADKLIACANIFPNMTSIYSWREKIEESNECSIIIKTTPIHCSLINLRLSEIHPYDCPCLVFWDINQGHPPFLKWIETQTQPVVG